MFRKRNLFCEQDQGEVQIRLELTLCVAVAVAGGQHLDVPQHLPLVLSRRTILLPVQDAWGKI